MPPPTICTVPDDIPLHPDAPDSLANQDPELGHCFVTSSFALIAENQRVMTAKARSASNREKTYGKSNHTKILDPVAQPVHHPRSKIARKMWAAKVTEKTDDKKTQDTTAIIAQVAHRECVSEIPESTNSQAACEQPTPFATNQNTNIDDTAATESRDAFMPLTPSSSPTIPFPPDVNQPDEDVVASPATAKMASSVTDINSAPLQAEIPATTAAVFSQCPVPSNGDEGAPLGTAEGSRTGSTAVGWRMIRPAPASAEETVLRPLSTFVEPSVGILDIKSKKTLPGKENDNMASSKSVSAAPFRRSQRILKRKRGENEDVV